MRRAGSIAACALGILLWAPSSNAWDSDEHAAMGIQAFQSACAASPDKIACSEANKAAFRDLAADGTEAPDYCHSFYFSNLGINVIANNAAYRFFCGIKNGTPRSQVNKTLVTTTGLTSSETNDALLNATYVLTTNNNHFGELTQPHYDAFHKLALGVAAVRPTLESVYATPPNAEVPAQNPLLLQCTRAAVALEGFALHYLTDRTAAGHAWNPEPRYAGIGSLSEARMAGLRTCFHGQDLATRGKISVATQFDCVDDLANAVGFDGLVYAGLGDTRRTFGGAMAGLGGWVSDDSYLTSALPSQQKATEDPAKESFKQVFAAFQGSGGSNIEQWSQAFVANEDFCHVVLPECCRNDSLGAIGTCDYCAPDITDAEVKSHCPTDDFSGDFPTTSNAQDGHWIPIASNLNGVNYVHYSGKDPTGITNAQTIAISANPSLVHPDAQWDVNNQEATLLGCADFEVTAADLGGASGTVLFVQVASVTFKGNPVRPLTAHFRPDAACTNAAVCKKVDESTTDRNSLVGFEQIDPINPKPVHLATMCPFSTTGGATASGYVYLTDANGAWTNAFPTSFRCP